ncbi:MAG: ribonuclease [Clostridiales bacterium]|nr:ribonuclease [Clostridiales bacterium]
MKNKWLKLLSLLLSFVFLIGITGCSLLEEWYEEETTVAATPAQTTAAIDEEGFYTSRDDVALYLHTYGHLPPNYITKKEAKELGWSSGSLDEYLYCGCIGGNRFGNNEGLLPDEDGRMYYECDIDTMHQSSRGPKRIVYSNDGLIYYTEDHYSSFTLLYGDP